MEISIGLSKKRIRRQPLQLLAAAVVAPGVFLGACSPPAPGGNQQTLVPARQTIERAATSFTLTSRAFSDGADIPQKFTCSGESASPQLHWSGAPADTQSFALIMDDPDAPSGTFTHWVAFDIPATQTEIPEGAQSVSKDGKNGRGQTGYTGPCPPSGTHRYFFTLYALDLPTLGLNDGAARAEVEKAMNGHIISQSQLMGRYSR